MRTSAPRLLPLFRSEMQIRLLALLLLQPERTWTLAELASAVGAPQSSVHRELLRGVDSGLLRRDASARPHRFRAAVEDPFYEPLASLLRLSVGVETQLRDALHDMDIDAAAIYGSWAGGTRRPDSDIDVIVIGDVALQDVRRRVRPIGKAIGRTIDVTVLPAGEFDRLRNERASYARRLLDSPVTPLVGDLNTISAS